MNKKELEKILENHKHYINEDCENWKECRADLSGANLSYADLSYADLSYADLSYADLSYADLSYADLSGANLKSANLKSANLKSADLSCANLKSADLSGADLSGAIGLLNVADYIKSHFKCTKDGVVVYKTFNSQYDAPKEWKIKPNSIIAENVDCNRTNTCGCGINVAPLDWVQKNYSGTIWRLLIRWEWAMDIVVPYNTDGKIRCGKAEIIEMVEDESE